MTLAGTLTPDPLSLRAHSANGSVGIRGAVGALKSRRPSQCERSGSGLADGSADSQQRYCANLGHRQDDETGTYTGGSPDGDGLVYMRARYYEPTTGRFVSEDPGRQGANWYSYCSGDPVNKIDATGRCDEYAVGWCAFAAFCITFFLVAGRPSGNLGTAFISGVVSGISAALIAAGCNAIGKAAEMSALAVAGAKLFGGGFINMVAELMVDMITEDQPGDDLAFAFISGGTSALFVPAIGDYRDAGLGLSTGGLGSFIKSIWDFVKRG